MKKTFLAITLAMTPVFTNEQEPQTYTVNDALQELFFRTDVLLQLLEQLAEDFYKTQKGNRNVYENQT